VRSVALVLLATAALALPMASAAASGLPVGAARASVGQSGSPVGQSASPVAAAAAGPAAGHATSPAAGRAWRVPTSPRMGVAGVRAAADADPGPGRILIGWSGPGAPPLDAGAGVSRLLPRLGIAVLAVPDVAAAVAWYGHRPGVAWAEADRPVVAADVPDDPLFGQQWTLQSGPGAAAESMDWTSVFPGSEGEGALVAVLDTGFTTGGSDQPVDLRADLARTFVPGTTDASDDNGHGTFVTDMIAGATDNNVGAAGIAPKAGVVPVKVLGADGTGDLSVVAEGIDYAVSVGAQVINLSLAGDASPALCAAVAHASATALVVAATGNEATAATPHPIDYPAACPGALAVGSVAFDGNRPDYANSGCGTAVVAPGGDDLDLFEPGVARSDWIVQQGYDPSAPAFVDEREEGTSMSAAAVAGEAALLFGVGAALPAVRDLIVGTARPQGGVAFSGTFGAGTVDMGAALAALGAHQAATLPDGGYEVATASGSVVRVVGGCGTTATQSLPSPPAAPVVGAAGTPDGLGSWLVASDGGIFSFGEAQFFGSTGAIRLNQPIVGMAATPTGHGYWLVASDGGIFSFGDAQFFGSVAASPLARPVVGMATTASGRGYWLLTGEGGVFGFGDAASFGNAEGDGPRATSQ
jgi:hypothetical protein